MKIKKYIDFIKESMRYNNSIWKLDEDDIKEYFYDFSDIGYIIDIELGFFKELGDRCLFMPVSVTGTGYNTPCYRITIVKSQNIRKENVTDSILFAIDMISKYTDSYVYVSLETDPLESLDINSVRIENGIYYNNNEINNISICFVCNKDVSIDQIKLSEINGWEPDSIKDNKIWIKVKKNELVDLLISPRSDYIDGLKDWDEIYDYYDVYNYSTDIYTLLKYELDKNNIELLVISLIKKHGIDIFNYENEKIKNQDDCINYYLNNINKLVEVIERLNKTQEPLNEILDIVGTYRMDAHINQNYKDLIEEFDEIVEKDFYFYKEEDGEETYYYLNFDNSWLDVRDFDDYYMEEFKSLHDVFENYINSKIFNYILYPNFKDYGDYDSVQMNGEISEYLRNYKKV